jgi:FkbM family methyltransferase
MRDFINGIAGCFSCSVIPNWRMEKLPIARRLQELFSRHNIDTLIDVGGNIGQFRDFIRWEVGFAGQIHSFEPVPELYDQLARKAQGDGRWSVHNLALGSEVGALKLNVMVGSDFSSFLKPLGTGGRAQRQKNVVAREVEVKVSTLDREFGDLLRGRRAFLKLDTQGFDLEVIRGAKRVLRDIPCLQTEISFMPLYDKMPGYNEAIEELKGLGYAAADMFLVAEDDLGRALEFDCVMVRTA